MQDQQEQQECDAVGDDADTSPVGSAEADTAAHDAPRRPLRRVGIFGLSANPPTSAHGHLGVVQALVNLFDELWVVPVYVHPFASKRKKLESFEHRMAMCKMNPNI